MFILTLRRCVMGRKAFRKSITVLVVMILLLLPVTTVFASGEAPPDVVSSKTVSPDLQQVEEMQARMKAYMDAIRKMEEHMYVGRDKLLHVDLASGAEIGVDEDIFQELKAALDITNARIKSGDLRLHEVSLSDGKNIFGEPVPLVATDTTLLLGSAGELLSRWCNGWTGVRFNWFGPRVYLNDCHTHYVIWLAGIGAGTATIGAAVTGATGGGAPAAVTLGVAAGVLTVGGATVGLIDEIGGHRGIYVQLKWPIWWWLPAPLGWIWHQ